MACNRSALFHCSSRALPSLHTQAWLDPARAAVGTKCNRLLVVDLVTRTATPCILPPAPPRASVAPPGADPPGAGVFGVEGPAGSGIHALALSPSGRALATGGADASDVQIMRVNGQRGRHGGAPRPPPLTPGLTLTGHTDWVFGLAWLTPRHVVSASRDRSLALWALPEGHDDNEEEEEEEGEEDEEMEGVEEGEGQKENASPPRPPFSSPPTTPRRLVRAGSSSWGRGVGGGGSGPAPAAAGAAAPPTACASAPAAAAACVASRAEKRDRVRDVRWDAASAALASLTSGGVVRTWDAGTLAPTGATRLAHDREAVCLAVGPGLIAAGSQAHVSLVDPRAGGGCGGGGGGASPALLSGGPALAFGGTRLGNAGGVAAGDGDTPGAGASPGALTPAGPPGAGVVADLDSPDGPTGVRSLCLEGHLLSAGTGAGRIAFFDLRAGRWAGLGFAPAKPPPQAPAARPPSPPPLSHALTAPPLPAPPAVPRTALAAGRGWVEPNAVFLEHFSGPDTPPVPPAIYAHAWSPAGPSGGLFAVGGPLATGLRGVYMGHWQ